MVAVLVDKSSLGSDDMRYAGAPGSAADMSVDISNSQKSTRSSATADIVHNASTQGHSRSSVVVPIDAAYMTYC